MAVAPLLSLKGISLTFGGKPLFTDVEATIGRGERACLVGRNGSGKSTLLKIIANVVEPDHGERIVQTGVRVAYLSQEPRLEAGATVEDFVAAGLVEVDDTYLIGTFLQALNLDGSQDIGNLSGGEGRRASLARALVSAPDVLLLDEPTNHLDIPTINWLENELSGFKGAMIMVSHDRAFLNRLTNKTFWMDRGTLRQREEGFLAFEKWSEEVANDEESELNRMNVKLKEETRWLARGVTARRKRNMGRLRALKELRVQRKEVLANKVGSAKLAAESGKSSGKVVINGEDLKKSYGEHKIVDGFTTKIIRGDRIGLIGPNGAGKTTLLRLLTGALEPDSGTLKLGTNLTLTYFDQKRDSLKDEETLWDSLAETGGDMIMVQDRQRHVVSYLKDFLFDERQARAPVSTLSGGERNRLLLAKLLAKPSNLLVMDEPTNDLDMETLDLLQEMLSEYQGTLLLVSHDRDFLDRLVTSVIAVEGDGDIQEYVGGYDDYVRQRGEVTGTTAPKEPKKGKATTRTAKKSSKLSYKDQRELDQAPRKMEELSAAITALEEKLHDPNFYTKDPEGFQNSSKELVSTKEALEALEERWLELEMMKEELK
ncbi:MAG: ATP-binding cassette domain-containing protein [Alphaproteobacteria bacterium]|nr:ATP-binding cassette domain-containing protein [Alphaproteobacteria bacterium]